MLYTTIKEIEKSAAEVRATLVFAPAAKKSNGHYEPASAAEHCHTLLGNVEMECDRLAANYELLPYASDRSEKEAILDAQVPCVEAYFRAAMDAVNALERYSARAS